MTLTKKRSSSLWLIHFIAFIDTLSFSVFLPTLQLQVAECGGSFLFFTSIVAVFNGAALISAPLMSRWCTSSSFRQCFFFCCFFNLVGSVLYALLENTLYLMIARFLHGMASGVVVVCQRYVSAVSNEEERPKMLTCWMWWSVSGFVGGCIASLILELSLGSIIDVWQVNVLNAPAFLVAAIALLECVLVLFLLQEPPKVLFESPIEEWMGENTRLVHDQSLDLSENSTNSSAEDCQKSAFPMTGQRPYGVPLMMWLVIIFGANTFWILFELLTTPILYEQYQWSILAISLAWLGIALLTEFVVLMVSGLKLLITDRSLFFGFWLFYLGSMLSILNYENWSAVSISTENAPSNFLLGTDIRNESSWSTNFTDSAAELPVWRYLLAFLLMCIGFTAENLITASAFSRIILYLNSDTWMKTFQVLARLAQIITSVITGVAYEYLDWNWFFLSIGIFYGLLLLFSLALHEKLFPKEDENEFSSIER